MARETMKLVANNKKAYHDFLLMINMRPELSCMAQR